MIHKLASALKIDPTELFLKEVSPETVVQNNQKAAIEDIGDELNKLISRFFAKKIRDIKKTGED